VRGERAQCQLGHGCDRGQDRCGRRDHPGVRLADRIDPAAVRDRRLPGGARVRRDVWGTGIKDALDGTLGGAVQTARVTDCQVEKLPIGAVEYIAAKFMIEVYS
jgi:hypothetical protein